MDLFSQSTEVINTAPLAERLRPSSSDDWLSSQDNPKQIQDLINSFKNGNIFSLILWGPPGCGKTSLANVLARESKANFIETNAIDLGSAKIRELCENAKNKKVIHQEPTILFVDEIHRLNKSQQDQFLPYLEKGYLYLLGATTENPSYELNQALLSRSRLIVLKGLSFESLEKIFQKALLKLDFIESNFFSSDAKKTIIEQSSGDARKLLNILEEVFLIYQNNKTIFPIDSENLNNVLSQNAIRFDKKGDEHYDVISAFIKSIRGSDPDAGVYYLARMLEGGEDPRFIARRLVILASEDIGNADPRALTLAVSTFQAVEMIGLPEARINLSQCVCYLASAPKSNKSYDAINLAQDFVKKTGALPVPNSLKSAQTKLAKSLGHGKDYLYSHNGEKGWKKQDFLPLTARDQKFYEPSDRGFEKNISEYLKWMKN